MKKPFYAQDFTKGQIFNLGKKILPRMKLLNLQKNMTHFHFT